MAEPATVIDRLFELRAEIEARLIDNKDYRDLKAIERAISDMQGEGHPIATNGDARPRIPRASMDFSDMTQADATEALLTSVLHEPTATSQLVKALRAHGLELSGAQPNINLSSVLSKDGRFRSVTYKDRRSWWVKGRPYPGELDTN